jgi:hypothetical protein
MTVVTPKATNFNGALGIQGVVALCQERSLAESKKLPMKEASVTLPNEIYSVGAGSLSAKNIAAYDGFGR